MADTMDATKHVVQDEFSKSSNLVSVKKALLKVVLPEYEGDLDPGGGPAMSTGGNVEIPLGYVQGMTLNMSQSIERMISLGQGFNYEPVVGVAVFTGTIRRMLVNTPNLLAYLKAIGALNEIKNTPAILKDERHYLGHTFSLDDLNKRTFKLYLQDLGSCAIVIDLPVITSWSVGINAGAVLIYEDVNFECASVTSANCSGYKWWS